MSLKYGLNVKKKAAPAPVRKPIFDDDEDDDNDSEQQPHSTNEIHTFSNTLAKHAPPRKLPKNLNNGDDDDFPQDSRQDLSSTHAAHQHITAAQSVDSTIFDYDTFHDAKTSVSAAKKAAARQDAIERKPKYINNLLDAAARRKQDQQVAREKLLQREREAEGDEFADKEKFVTGAYKAQQEETRRLEEEEAKKAEGEEKRRRMLGGGSGGMQGFYRGMMDQQERSHREAVEAAAKVEQRSGNDEHAGREKEKSDVELAAEMKARGVNVHLNDEGQVTDKRELLSAGLNVAPSGKSNDGRGADHLKVSGRSQQSAFPRRDQASRDAQRERQTRMMEEQLASQAKRAREEEEEERQKLENASKSTKTAGDVSDAKARYLARKAAKERGEG